MSFTRSRGVVVVAAVAVLGLLSPANAQGTAIGTWNDVGTTGTAQTKVVESGCVAYGSDLTCSIAALAEQRATNPPRQGSCTDTTVTVSGQSFAGPCRASFGGVVVMQRTGTLCNGGEFADGTKPAFQYANTLGVNTATDNLSVTVVNNVVTVRGEVVDVNGTRLQEMKGTFMIQCRNSTHFGSWAGSFKYAF